MFFCFRGSNDFRDGLDSYKIGYSYSYDLAEWHRTNWVYNPFIERSVNNTMNWDYSMQSYPQLLNAGDDILMFYNGNGFGYNGFGLASCPCSKFLQFSRSFL